MWPRARCTGRRASAGRGGAESTGKVSIWILCLGGLGPEPAHVPAGAVDLPVSVGGVGCGLGGYLVDR